MSHRYTLTVHHQSTEYGDFCIFQELPGEKFSNLITLAWLSKSAHPSTRLVFSWETIFNFVWSNSLNNETTAHVITHQVWDADLKTSNKITLDHLENAYTFKEKTQGDEMGTLYINQTQRVIPKAINVGIGMNGKGTFLVPSQPNIQLSFTPNPIYWIAFGLFKEGQEINVQTAKYNACKLLYNGASDLEVKFTKNNIWYFY